MVAFMKRFFQDQLRVLLAGLLAALPLIITAGIVGWVANFLFEQAGPQSLTGRILSGIGFTVTGEGRVYLSYALGILIVITGLYLLGRLVESGMRGSLVGALESLLRKIPVIGSVYDTAERFVGLFDRKGRNERLQGMSPVWVHFGGEGGTAVLGLMPTPDVLDLGGRNYHVVLVPTAPVPFGGGLLYVPAGWVRAADFGAEALTSIYVSMGATSPHYINGVRMTKPHRQEDLNPGQPA